MRDQNIQDFAQPLPNVCQVCWGAAGKRKRRLLFVAFNLITQLRPRTCNGESVFVEKFLDAQHAFHVAATIHPLSSIALHGSQLREFRLPKAHYVCRQTTYARHFPDSEIELFWNDD